MRANRDENGRFVAGNNTNPSGRPKVPQEVRDAIRAACPEAVEVLIGIMRNKKEKTAYRLEAAKTLLERGYGKPEVMSKVEVSTTEDTKIIFHWINERNRESNGARIRLYGADNPDAMRGIYFNGVILDEVADMKPSGWGEVVRPTLSDCNGWACFIGTPKGMNMF